MRTTTCDGRPRIQAGTMKAILRITLSLLMPLLTVLACSEPTEPSTSPRALTDAASAANPTYTITDLGTLRGGFAEARAINDAGQVVGLSGTAPQEQHAFLWTAAGGMTDLGTLGGKFSVAHAINHGGHVAGIAELPSGERHAFLWTPSAGMEDLGSLGGPFARARGINDLDQVIGVSSTPDGSLHPFFWTATQGMTDLAPIVGNNTEAEGINNRQEVVGGGPGGPCVFTMAFLWSARDGFRNLGAFGFRDPCGGADAAAINENDVVVGLSENNSLQTHAFRWTAAAGMVDIGTPFGASGFSQAAAINEQGQIAGYSENADATIQHAAVWDEHSGWHDLGTLPGHGYSQANGINARGQIVGFSSVTRGVNAHAVLWTPSTQTRLRFRRRP
jgi:probable HAF family extracellular repeat protein